MFPQQPCEPMFHVVVTHTGNGMKTIVSNPLTRRQAEVIRSKMTQYPWRTITVEAVTQFKGTDGSASPR